MATNPFRDVTTLNGYREEIDEFISGISYFWSTGTWERVVDALGSEHGGWYTTIHAMYMQFPNVEDAKAMINLLRE